MKNVIVLLFIVCLLTGVNSVLAETVRGINIDFVNIGNAGNSADPTTGSLYGAVGYNYKIGKYEITNAQWNAFTSAAGAPNGTGGGYSEGAVYTGAQNPANCTSWYEAVQFCNYLTSGNKSKGVYKFSGTNEHPGSFLGVDRAAAQATYGKIYCLPTEDEWYKAAFFKPNASGYSLYAFGTSTAPIAGVETNYNEAGGNMPWNVGTGRIEQNGTYDMMGNVWEWTETPYDSSQMTIRGGSYGVGIWMDSFLRSYIPTDYEIGHGGFRIVSVPEPTTMFLVSLGCLILRRNKKI